MIRPVGDDRVAALAEIHARAFDTPWSQNEIAKLMQNPAVFALLAEDEAAHGFVLAWAAAGDSEVLTLAVAPEARRSGVGSALMTMAMANAALCGATGMTLDVAADNTAARALYERLGFVEVGRRIGYYLRADGAADALVLRRGLPVPSA